MNGSSDIGDIISKLTENPEMMKSLMGVANNIMSKEGDKDERCDEKRGETPDLKLSCDKKERKKGDDAENLIRLLLALRPFVGEEKCSKIDGIIKILKLVQLSEKTGILRSLI